MAEAGESGGRRHRFDEQTLQSHHGDTGVHKFKYVSVDTLHAVDQRVDACKFDNFSVKHKSGLNLWGGSGDAYAMYYNMLCKM